MADDKKTINWHAVVTNAVSTLVAAVFVGAAVIVWTSATSIDDKINKATNDIKSTIEITTDEIATLSTEIKLLKSRIESQEKILTSNANVRAGTKNIIQPSILESEKKELIQENTKRILQQYQINRLKILPTPIPAK